MLVDSLTLTAWEYRVLEEMQRSAYAQLELVIINAAPDGTTSFLHKLHTRWRYILFSLYFRLDYRLMRRFAKSDAFASRDASALLRDVPQLQVVPVQKGFTDRFPEESVAAVKAANLDVLIRFGFRIVRGEILDAARFGMWSLHHGCNEKYRGGPAFFWEIYRDDPASATVLQVLTDKLDAGKIIYKSWSSTYRYSLFLSRNPAFWKTSDFYLRRLRDLHRHGWDYIESSDVCRTSYDYSAPINRTPTNGQILIFATRLAARIVAKAWQKLTTREQWFLAIRKVTESGSAPWTKIEPPKDRYWADPFVLNASGKNYLFLEDFRYDKNRAHLSVGELVGESLGPTTTVLDLPIHLSYPFVFEEDGTFYMIPETRQAGNITLYRADRFPESWVVDTVLVDGVSAVDTTVLKSQHLYWLFTCIAVPGAVGSDELHVFYSENLRGPWKPHKANPVISDVRRARSAGRIFMQDGAIIRPSQDCSGSYGRAIVLNRIDMLTPNEYRETPVGRIDGSEIPGNLGSHTLARDGGLEIIDGRAAARRW